MTKRLAIFVTLAFGCGNDPGSAGTPDAAEPPPVDAAGPPVLVCGNPDIDAPVVWSTSPHDREIGIDEALPVTFDIADGCGVDMASIALKIGGTVVTPSISGDAKNLRVTYAPPDGFARDAIIAAELVVADAAGNTSTTPLTFRIWDDYTIYVRAVAGIDSTMPTTNLGFREWYRVRAASGEQRMLARFVFANDTSEPGLTYKTARLHACAKPVAEPRTISAYLLHSEFESGTVTWVNRTAAAQWLAMGADAVGADRASMSFATLTFAPSTDYWSRAESAQDMTLEVQGWYDNAAQNFGIIFIGTAADVEVSHGNCPLQVKGFLARPLP